MPRKRRFLTPQTPFGMANIEFFSKIHVGNVGVYGHRVIGVIIEGAPADAWGICLPIGRVVVRVLREDGLWFAIASHIQPPLAAVRTVRSEIPRFLRSD
jgi:hypothetical protein